MAGAKIAKAAAKTMLDGVASMTKSQRLRENLLKASRLLHVAPIVPKKGWNLKGMKMPLTEDDIGYLIRSPKLAERIRLDPIRFQGDALDELAGDVNMSYVRGVSDSSFVGPVNSFGMLKELRMSPRDFDRNYSGGFDRGLAKKYAEGVLFDSDNPISGYKVVTAYPDGSVHARATVDGDTFAATVDKSGTVLPIYGDGSNSRARRGSTGQWISIPGRGLRHLDFDSRVPVSFVRDRGLEGRNFTEFNPNLKKYREGFPVAELDQSKYSRIGRTKRNTRNWLQKDEDPYLVNFGNGPDTRFMMDAKSRADQMRAERAGIQFDSRIAAINEEEAELDRQIEALKAKRDSIRDVYWNIRDMKDSVMDAARRYR